MGKGRGTESAARGGGRGEGQKVQLEDGEGARDRKCSKRRGKG